MRGEVVRSACWYYVFVVLFCLRSRLSDLLWRFCNSSAELVDDFINHRKN